jgi:hypothetical protein
MTSPDRPGITVSTTSYTTKRDTISDRGACTKNNVVHHHQVTDSRATDMLCQWQAKTGPISKTT